MLSGSDEVASEVVPVNVESATSTIEPFTSIQSVQLGYVIVQLFWYALLWHPFIFLYHVLYGYESYYEYIIILVYIFSCDIFSECKQEEYFLKYCTSSITIVVLYYVVIVISTQFVFLEKII